MQKQIVKGKDLLADLQRESSSSETTGEEQPEAEQPEAAGAAEAQPEVDANGSIVDLATSLQTQLTKFGRRLNDTRQRLEDTSLCYQLLDKVLICINTNFIH